MLERLTMHAFVSVINSFAYKLLSGKSPVAAVKETAASIAASAKAGLEKTKAVVEEKAMAGRGGWPEENVMNGFDTEEDSNDMEEDPGPIDEESEGIDLDGPEEEEEEIEPDSLIEFEWNGEGLGKVLGVRDFWEAKYIKVVGEIDRLESQLEKLKVDMGQQIKRLERSYWKKRSR
ncbi:hypothetical protein RJ639_023520 [Escallonia herrerae]|uniref:Uncharacterized protein n=1 Tax=Escallonia herrerae TaxID=1293975 RepID=A0AA88UZG2_9ASTE|nr:hypothetical protein RJ639_023520 [Escallonia herrerae]